MGTFTFILGLCAICCSTVLVIISNIRRNKRELSGTINIDLESADKPIFQFDFDADPMELANSKYVRFRVNSKAHLIPQEKQSL